MLPERGRKQQAKRQYHQQQTGLLFYASNITWRVLRFCLGTHGDSCPLNIATRCVIEMEYLRRRQVSQQESEETSPQHGALLNIYI